MEWQLVEVTEDIPWVQDNSGVYTVIHRQVENRSHKEYSGEIVRVRVDLMANDTNEPLVSFFGTDANRVRKAVIDRLNQFTLNDKHRTISRQHASYIGYEIHKAFVTPNYVQD